MDKTLVGIIAAIGAITPLSAAQAEVSPAELDSVMNASSFAELLHPIPNAVAILKVADEQPAVSSDEGVQLAQDYHHHHHFRQYYHHHHHHHYYYYRHHHHHYYY